MTKPKRPGRQKAAKNQGILPEPGEITAALDRRVYGQDAAKNALASAMHDYLLGLAHNDAMSRFKLQLSRPTVLLHGPTGTGKTFLVKTLASLFELPFIDISMTAVVGPGYQGQHLDTAIQQALLVHGELARGVVFLDEIDKKHVTQGYGGKDVSGLEVQRDLLTLIEGRKIEAYQGQNRMAVDTSRLLFVLAGSFTGISELVKARCEGPSAIGFSMAQEPVKEEITLTDFEKYGMIPELLGRISSLAELQALSADDLVQLMQKENSILAERKRYFELVGIDLDLREDALLAIAERALKLGTNARSLRAILDIALAPHHLQRYEMQRRGVTRLVIDAAALQTGQAHEEFGKATLTSRLGAKLRAALPGLPAEFEEKPGSTEPDTEPWTPIEVLAELESLETEIEVAKAPAAARVWWRHLHARYESTPQMLLRIALETKKRETTLEHLHAAYLEAGVESFQGMFNYLSYMLVRDQERRAAKPDRPAVPRPSLDAKDPEQFRKDLEAFFERCSETKGKKPPSPDNSGDSLDDIPF